MSTSRIEREKYTVAMMIALYCHRNHFREGICTECAALLDYASQRLEKCPFQEGKTTCAKCPIHCYKPEMRTQIRNVMRFSGPRMLFVHPLLAIRHLIDSRRKQPLKTAGKPTEP